jgi:hypothetical protein
MVASMPNIFNADIAGKLNKAMGSLLFDVVLTKRTSSLRSQNLTAGIDTIERQYTGRGFVEDYTEDQIDGTRVQVGDRKITILGASITVVPEIGDSLTIEGATYIIVHIRRDPAGATYECQSR